MPWTAKQLKLFRAAAHNPAIAKSSGIKQADAERMSKEGLKKSSGGLTNFGGNVKKYAKGGFAEEFRNARNRAILEGNDPDKEVFTFNGKKYTAKLDKSEAKSEYPRGFLERARKSEDRATAIEKDVDRAAMAALHKNVGDREEMANLHREAGDRAAMAALHREAGVRGRDVSQEELSKYNYRKGGSVESKAMVKKEVAFMKKKGAPASMIKHEAAEMGAMKKGGMMRSKKDIAADQMAMAPYKEGGMKYARGGGIESRGKTKGTMIKMASGGYVKAADGCASRGKTKGKMI